MCRQLRQRIREGQYSIDRLTLERDRLQGDCDDLRHNLADTQSRLDVARGQIEELISYQEVSRQWADSLASRFASHKFRQDESL